MKERPVLFSAPMVRAILAGTKTQTRRVMKIQPEGGQRPLSEWSRGLAASCHDHNPDQAKLDAHSARLEGRVFPFTTNSGSLVSYPCPYGHPGDRLWVRETWKVMLHSPGYDNGLQESGGEDSEPGVATVAYDAGGEMLTVDFLEEIEDEQAARACKGKWKPSIHMPRWASRILLEITGVRVERLQDISTEDCIAEGIVRTPLVHLVTYVVPGTPIEKLGARAAYQSLWESINGPGSWDANPWVWVVEFRIIK